LGGNAHKGSDAEASHDPYLRCIAKKTRRRFAGAAKFRILSAKMAVLLKSRAGLAGFRAGKSAAAHNQKWVRPTGRGRGYRNPVARALL
jgi:hypothetical protein